MRRPAQPSCLNLYGNVCAKRDDLWPSSAALVKAPSPVCRGVTLWQSASRRRALRRLSASRRLQPAGKKTATTDTHLKSAAYRLLSTGSLSRTIHFPAARWIS